MPSEDEEGRWITKVEGKHHCRLPEVGDYYDLQFGYDSIWECACGQKWIYGHGLGYWSEDGWEKLEAHMKRNKDWEAYYKTQTAEKSEAESKPTFKKHWWNRV